MFKRIAILTAAVTASSVVAVAAATAASATPIGEGFYTNSSTCTSAGLGYQAQGHSWECPPSFQNGQSGYELYVNF